MNPPIGLAQFSTMAGYAMGLRMPRTRGIRPDAGLLTVDINGPQPRNVNGDLTITYGGNTVKMRGCRLGDEPDISDTTVSYPIRDRRWAWKYQKISGRYNLRTAGDKVDKDTRKTPNELGDLLMEALGESRYDIKLLPKSDKVLPSVDWHIDRADQMLQDLAEAFGLEIAFGLNDRVKLVRPGVGKLLPQRDQRQLAIAPPAVELAEFPDALIMLSAPTLFEEFVKYEAVMVDLDGEKKPIADISFKPDGGWGTLDPDSNITKASIDTSGLSPVEIDRALSITRTQLYKLYSAVGFRPEFNGTPKIKAPVNYKIPKRKGRKIIYEDGVVSEMKWVDLKPYRARIVQKDNPGGITQGVKAGRYEFEPAIVGGFFYDVFNHPEEFNEKLFTEYKGSYSIQETKQEITFSRKIYAKHYLPTQDKTRTPKEEDFVWNGRWDAAEIYCLQAMNVRQEKTGILNQYGVWYDVPGVDVGTGAEEIEERGVVVYHEMKYPAKFNDNVSELNKTNEKDVKTILKAKAVEKAREYKSVEFTRVVPFEGIVTDWDLSGTVNQIRFEVGNDAKARTIVSTGTEFDTLSPRTKKQRQWVAKLQKAVRESEKRQGIDQQGTEYA